MTEAMNTASRLHKIDVQTVVNGDRWNFLDSKGFFDYKIYRFVVHNLSVAGDKKRHIDSAITASFQIFVHSALLVLLDLKSISNGMGLS